jgi:hypothetical protein
MKRLLCLALLLSVSAAAQTTPRKRAVLIGIDDYSASGIPAIASTDHRGWPDLKGAANDAGILREMLVSTFGFRSGDVVVLTNQQATRAAILRAIDQHLVRPAAKGDVLLFYFAGHGSQIPNPASDEPDRLDESIVPADSRRGAPDIRDKELRSWFNRILDREAQLTLLLDHCHSGSGFRGLPNGAQPRGIRPGRPVADPGSYGPRPEERGALVLAATQDPDTAWETLGDDGRMHGAFTWAWICALRDARDGEPVHDTFLRAQARLRADKPYQAAAMLGPSAARRRPFLSTRRDRRGNRTVIAVERVERDGSVILQGGWTNGMAVGTELRIAAARLRITHVLGPGRSVARMENARHEAAHPGALAEVVAWAALPGRPLRIWMPRTAARPRTVARALATAYRGSWMDDPTEGTPTHVLRPRGSAWELLARDSAASPFPDGASAIAAVARLRPDTSLFVQFPATAAIIRTIGTGPGIVHVNDPRAADYILAGHYQAGRMEYAWVRPLVRDQDGRGSGLPLRTAWTDSATTLRNALLKLRRIHAWHVLESPPDTPSPYRLTLQRTKTGEPVRGGSVIGAETYQIVLRAREPLPEPAPRYYYAFVVDAYGQSHLLFPRGGSIENRFPLGDTAPAAIPLRGPHTFRIKRPYGVDTYFLLSTDEPLPNPSILAWDGVRIPTWSGPLTPLEELLLLTITGNRGKRTLMTRAWSLERVTFESIAPRRR